MTLHEYAELVALALKSVQVTDGDGHQLDLDGGAGRAVAEILRTSADRHKVMLIGNGGSAAIVSHIQNDLCKALGVRAIVFNETPLLTALSNDEGYGRVFEQPIALWSDPNDLVIAVSSSGASENIVRAVAAARARQSTIVTLSGFKPDNPLRQMGDINFFVPANAYGNVEVVHMALLHFFVDRGSVARVQMEQV